MYSSYLGIYAARNEDLMVKIGILGAGSWGLGLAMLLNNNGHEVTVWSVFPDEIKELDETRENKRCLPGVIFPEHIKFNADTEYVVKNSDVLILAVASPYTRSTAKLIAPFVKEGQYIVNVGKGIEEHTLKTLCEVTKDEIPQAVIAVLSGPSHAEEVGRGIPTTCVIGTAKKADAQFLQNVFMSNVFRVYISPDVLGICIGGALKNVIALASGVADGLGYGDNTKAEDLLDKAKNFVSQYNSVLGTTKSMNSYSILQTAVWGTEQMNLSQGLLNKVGITINDDNTLSLDETKFKAANMSDLKALFSGSGSLADRVAQKASTLYNQSTNQIALNQGKSTYTMFGTLI